MNTPGNNAPPPVPPIYSDEQIDKMAELTGRHAAERTALAVRQQNARVELLKRHEAERLQLGITALEPLEEPGSTGLEEKGGRPLARVGGIRGAGR